MIKYLGVVMVLVTLTQAQRPPYAGRPSQYPAVLPRFAETTQAPVAAADVGSRVDVDADGAVVAPSTTTTTTTPIPLDLPIQAFGDADLVNRIKTWPKEKQPFWFINSQQIGEHLNPSGTQNQRPTVAARSFFAG